MVARRAGKEDGAVAQRRSVSVGEGEEAAGRSDFLLEGGAGVAGQVTQ